LVAGFAAPRSSLFFQGERLQRAAPERSAAVKRIAGASGPIGGSEIIDLKIMLETP